MIKEEKDSYGNLSVRRYYENGILHRDSGPATQHFQQGVIRLEGFYNNGELIKQITYNLDSSPMRTEYYKYNKLHRVNGPAIIYNIKYQNDYLLGEDWYVNGSLHKIDGPAVINETKTYSHKEWWENGKLIKKEKILK